MCLKRRGYLLRKIKLDRSRGSIEWVAGLFFILFLSILLCVELQLSVYHASSMYLEDALAASNLASAVIDLKAYGTDHVVRIRDVSEAYIRYQDAVKQNLQLNENWECDNSALISGVVSIERYIIYNVEKNLVSIYSVSDTGAMQTEQKVLGSVTAPNGLLIENTSIYSEISFPVKGLWGSTIVAHKGKLIDIVSTNQPKESEEYEGNEEDETSEMDEGKDLEWEEEIQNAEREGNL